MNMYESNFSMLVLSFVLAFLPLFQGINGIQYVGCFDDNPNRILKGPMIVSDSQTPQLCIKSCYSRDYKLAGTQYANQCFCGNKIEGSARTTGGCDTNCVGNPEYKCGGTWKMNIYDTGVSDIKEKYIGCFEDSTNRILNGPFFDSNSQTPQLCTDYCYSHGYQYAGNEYSNECFCGNNLNTSAGANEYECNMNCAGNPEYKCGGTWRLNIYYTDRNYVKDKYVGCFRDTRMRMLYSARIDNNKLTPQFCMYECNSRGFRYAGTQYARECYCGNNINLTAKAFEQDCNMDCGGNPAYKCGGTWRMNIYDVGVPEVNEIEDKYVGCFQDTHKRMLYSELMVNNGLIPQMCINYCYSRGFSYAGTQYSNECFCGNDLNINNGVDEADCNANCAGNVNFVCGAGWRMNVYDTGIPENDREKDKYIGCFLDTPERMLPSALLVSSSMKPQTCIEHCRKGKYHYAGTEDSNQCFCGNNINMNAKVNGDDCGMNCAGNDQFICGDAWRLSVYDTGVLSQEDWLAVYVQRLSSLKDGT